MRMLAFMAIAVVFAATRVESNDDQGMSNWGVRAALYLQKGEIHHSMIEESVGAFQEDNDLSGHWPGGIIGGVRYRKYFFELEWSMLWGPRIDFMDEDHFLEIDETKLVVWCRRIIRVPLGKLHFVVLPGAGVGYSWAGATVAKYGSAETNKPANTTEVLTSSDVMFSAGINVECRLFSYMENGKRVGIYAGFSGTYQFDGPREAEIANDGYIFFPGGSEFDFSGYYFGFGIAMHD